MLSSLFQDPQLPIWAIVVVAIISTGAFSSAVTFLFTRRGYNATTSKTEADAASVLGRLADDLAKQLKAAHEEIPVWKAKITDEEKKARQLGLQVEGAEKKLAEIQEELELTTSRLIACEDREPLGIDRADAIRDAAADIIEQVSHLSFVATGPPTEEDLGAIRRLKVMRERCREIETAMQ